MSVSPAGAGSIPSQVLWPGQGQQESVLSFTHHLDTHLPAAVSPSLIPHCFILLRSIVNSSGLVVSPSWCMEGPSNPGSSQAVVPALLFLLLLSARDAAGALCCDARRVVPWSSGHCTQGQEVSRAAPDLQHTGGFSLVGNGITLEGDRKSVV